MPSTRLLGKTELSWRSKLEKLFQEFYPNEAKLYSLGQMAHYAKKWIDALKMDERTSEIWRQIFFKTVFFGKYI